MKITLTRRPSVNGWTLGDLAIDGVHQSWTCEDVVREGAKVYGDTAIPAGRYRVVVTYSNRFQRDLPLLVDVPGFTGIRIHSGNTAKDTQGCIMPGLAYGVGGVVQSRAAFDNLFDRIKAADGEVWIEIVQG